VGGLLSTTDKNESCLAGFLIRPTNGPVFQQVSKTNRITMAGKVNKMVHGRCAIFLVILKQQKSVYWAMKLVPLGLQNNAPYLFYREAFTY